MARRTRFSKRWIVPAVGIGVVAAACSSSQVDVDDLDGGLDCLQNGSWAVSGDPGSEASGPDTAEEAVSRFLARYQRRYGGDVVVLGAGGSLVVDGKEVVVVGSPSTAPAGGWILLGVSGCEGFGP